MASDPVLSRQDLIAAASRMARETGCFGNHDGICCELCPEDPKEWCEYCLIGAIAQALQEDEHRRDVSVTLSTSSSETSAQSWHYIVTPHTASDAALVPRLRTLLEFVTKEQQAWIENRRVGGCVQALQPVVDELQSLLAVRVREGA